MARIRKTMVTHRRKRSSTQLPLFNSSIHTQIHSVLPFFGFINMTISCGTAIYRAYINGDKPMLAFVTFVYFGTFLLDYWFRQCNKLPPCEKSPKKLNLKIGIWVLLSAIMLGFAYEFSGLMSFAASLCFFGIVIGGSGLLFVVYFVWDGDVICSAWRSKGGKRRKAGRRELGI